MRPPRRTVARAKFTGRKDNGAGRRIASAKRRADYGALVDSRAGRNRGERGRSVRDGHLSDEKRP